MLVEQIFELKGPGSPGRICTPITGCFQDKTIISKENIRLDCYLLLKSFRRQCALLPPSAPNHFQNLTPKCKILTCFGLKLQSKGELNNFIFSIGFQMLKV